MAIKGLQYSALSECTADATSPAVNIVITTTAIADERGVLAQHDLGRALGEESKPAAAARVAVDRDDGAHRLARRVERVHLAEAVLGHAASYRVVVLAEPEHEAEQCTLGLVADLLSQVALAFARLPINRCPYVRL